jgi:hypothetical protein
MWDYCALAKAAGFSVVVGTATYRESAGYTGLPSKAVGDAGIDALNALVRAEWAQHADRLADIGALAIVQNSLTATADGTHFTQTTDDVIANCIGRQVSSVLRST